MSVGTALTLYEIADHYRHALATIEDSGLPEEAIRDTLESLEGDVTVKAQNVLAYAGNLEAEADAVAGRIASLQARKKALEARSEWLRSYVLAAMQHSGVTEIRCPDFVAKPQQNPERVVIDNEAGIGKFYWRVVPATREIDRQAIKEALKAGTDPELAQAAHLERGWRLSIK